MISIVSQLTATFPPPLTTCTVPLSTPLSSLYPSLRPSRCSPASSRKQVSQTLTVSPKSLAGGWIVIGVSADYHHAFFSLCLIDLFRKFPYQLLIHISSISYVPHPTTHCGRGSRLLSRNIHTNAVQLGHQVADSVSGLGYSFVVTVRYFFLLRVKGMTLIDPDLPTCRRSSYG